METIYLKCYLNQNLGDDLFVKIITDRYVERFISVSTIKCSRNYNISNLKVKYFNDFIFRIFNKFSKLINSNNILEQYYINKSKFVVFIAGSIFIESKEEKRRKYLLSEWYSNLNKPYYIIGANIGPFYTREFIKNVNFILNNAEDVCLRDSQSKKLCSSKKVRQASDIIFSLDASKYITNSKTKSVIISIIDCDFKASQIPNPNSKCYKKTIIDMIEFFQSRSYEIILMSFCKEDGDEKAVDEIFYNLNNKSNIRKYYYRGNIDEALSLLGSSKVIVGSRFHANVLGLLMNKTIIPIIYNNKTKNLLFDLNFKGRVIDINNIEKFDISSLNDDDLNYKLDVSFCKKDAERHFEKLDKILKRRD